MHSTRSDAIIMVHVVWATRYRTPLIPARLDLHLRSLILASLSSLAVDLHAFGAFDDHVHVLVQLPTTATLAEVVQAMKGASARRWNEAHADGVSSLYWQDGYWARSVCSDHLSAARRYVLRQRERHSRPHPPEPWELTLFEPRTDD